MISGFQNGWLLVAAAAVVIPLLLLLWRRREVREVPFAAMGLLLAAAQSRLRKTYLARIILLLLRMGILLVLSLAVAGPLWQQAGAPVDAGGRRTHWILVIDDSFSMQYIVDQISLLDRAKQRAGALFDSAASGDAFSIITMTEPPQWIGHPPTMDPAVIKRALAALTTAQLPAELPGTLQQVSRCLAESSASQRWQWQRVVFLSDFAANTWRSADENEVQRQFAQLAATAYLQFESVAPPAMPNVAVSHLQADLLRPTIGQPIQLQTRIEAYQLNQPRTVQVELLVDGRQTGRQSLQVAPQRPAWAAFDLTTTEPGQAAVEVRITSDSLAIDDQRRLVLQTQPHVQMLCVEDRPGISQSLMAALQTEPGVHLTVVPHLLPLSDLASIDLHSYSVVVLCNVQKISADHAVRLGQFVQQGGGLIALLGDRTDVAVWQQAWSAAQSDRLPLRFRQLSEPGLYSLQPGEYAHPIIAPFRGFDRAGLLDMPVWRYVQLQPDEPAAEPALRFDNGDPALIAIQSGGGRMVFLAAAPSSPDVEPQWSVFEAWWSFVPLVNEMLRWTIDSDPNFHTVAVGDTIAGSLPRQTVQQPLRIQLPDGSSQRVPRSSGADGDQWSFGPVPAAGFLRLYQEPASGPQQVFAANVVVSESDTSSIDLAALRTWERTPSIVGVSSADNAPNQTTWLAGALLLALIVMLVMETLIAWRSAR